MKRHILMLSAALLMGSLSSCSVAMAAKGGGASFKEVQASKTRGDLTAIADQVVSTTTNEEGQTVEVYKISQKKGSVARSLMHGVLDVSTLGLWEVVGTPIEASQSTEHMVVEGTFDNEGKLLNLRLL